jgi:WD40 repeat protein
VPYSEEDAPFFFGRTAETEIITANLMASRLTVLYGASGVGKTSVLRAGVVHHLREQARANLQKRNTAEFGVVYFNEWNYHPVAMLEERIYEQLSAFRVASADFPLDPPTHFPEFLEQWSKQIDGDLLIILDQFEEYFLYHAQEDGPGTFFYEFPRALKRPDLRVSFLISMREDALAKLDRFKGRIPNLFDNYLRIEHLDRDAARDAIEKPLAEYNRLRANESPITIEPGLVDAVLEQVKTGQVIIGEAGRGVVKRETDQVEIETPYLQLVMTRLWDEEMRAGAQVLKLATLNALGGAEKIVRTHLDETMRALTAHEQDAAARAFNMLVTPSGAKIAHTIRDLAFYAQTREEDLTQVLEKLASVRILRPVAPPLDQPQTPRYEIFHDVLAPAVLDWRARFVDAQKRAEQQQQLARERQRTARLRWGIAGLSLFVLAMVALLIFALSQKNIADSRELAASAISNLSIDPELSMLLAMAGVRATYTTQAEDALRQSLSLSYVRATLRGHTDRVLSASFSSDGKTIVTASFDGAARVWDAVTGQSRAELRGHTGYVVSASFSPDGKTIVTASWDNTARVWDAVTGQSRAELSGHTGSVFSASFSPDGKTIVTASYDGTARVWDAVTGQSRAELRGHTGSVDSASFSPDGKTIVTASWDGTARVWDAVTWQSRAELRGLMGSVSSASFSPDGKTIVTASRDKTARVWDAVTGQSRAELRGHTDGVNSASFSPDGKTIVTASRDKTARVWDAVTGQSRAELRGHTDGVMSASFSPDGKTIVTVSEDDTVRVWDVVTGQNRGELRGHTGSVFGASFSPDGKTIVTASWDETARVWDAATGQSRAELRGHTNRVNSASFSPDGKMIVTASRDGTARVWDATTGQSRAELRGHTREVVSASFSPDGKMIVTASYDGTARIFLVNIEDLIELARTRVTRQLTCEERNKYLHENAVCK